MRFSPGLVLLSTIGCAGATAVAPGERPPVGPEVGLVVLVVDTDTPLDGIIFYNDEGAIDVSIPRADRGISTHLVRAPVGRYRLTNYRGPHAIHDAARHGKQGICFDVTPGSLSDPGQFQFRQTGEGNGWTKLVRHRWNRSTEDTSNRLKDKWPQIAEAFELQATTCRR